VGRFTFGVILGLAIGIIDVLLMLPLAFPDKRAALLGAFSSRFALGFFATVVKLPTSPIASGVLVGVLTSIPDAIVTKAYAPILITGVVFGAIAGWVVGRWAGLSNDQRWAAVRPPSVQSRQGAPAQLRTSSSTASHPQRIETQPLRRARKRQRGK
jgi:hypothetical protein